jgi:uncharacterized phiE125 gp8 family phage protein
MLRAQRTQPPAVRVLSLAEVKEHIRIEADDEAEDVLLSAMIMAAENKLDGYSGLIGRCLIDQKWTYALDDWPPVRLSLPLLDVSAVSVSYYDDGNTKRQLPDNQYLLQQGLCGPFLEWMDNFVSPSVFDRADGVQVEMTCGFGPAVDDVPADLRLACKLLVANWYQNRETVVIGASLAEMPVPNDILWLLSGYRRSII